MGALRVTWPRRTRSRLGWGGLWQRIVGHERVLRMAGGRSLEMFLSSRAPAPKFRNLQIGAQLSSQISSSSGSRNLLRKNDFIQNTISSCPQSDLNLRVNENAGPEITRTAKKKGKTQNPSQLSHLNPPQLLHSPRQLGPKVPLNSRINKLMHANDLLPSLIKVQRPHILIHILAHNRIRARPQPKHNTTPFAVLDAVLHAQLEVLESRYQALQLLRVLGVVRRCDGEARGQDVPHAAGRAVGHYRVYVHCVEGGDHGEGGAFLLRWRCHFLFFFWFLRDYL